MANLSNLVLQREDKLGDMMGIGSFHFQKKLKEKKSLSCPIIFRALQFPGQEERECLWSCRIEDLAAVSAVNLCILPTISPRINACCNLFLPRCWQQSIPKAEKYLYKERPLLSPGGICEWFPMTGNMCVALSPRHCFHTNFYLWIRLPFFTLPEWFRREGIEKGYIILFAFFFFPRHK